LDHAHGLLAVGSLGDDPDVLLALGRAGELSWSWVAITVVGLALVIAAPVHIVTVVGFLAMSVGLGAAGARLLRT
jgi:hypothetical protein